MLIYTDDCYNAKLCLIQYYVVLAKSMVNKLYLLSIILSQRVTIASRVEKFLNAGSVYYISTVRSIVLMMPTPNILDL